jgi:hypothetical protein
MRFTNFHRKKAENIQAEILAAKPIEIMSEDGESVQYTLEFNRSTAAELEENGFYPESFAKGTQSDRQKQLLLLFAGAFRMHHSEDEELFSFGVGKDGERFVEADDEKFEELLYALDEDTGAVVTRLMYLYYKPTVALSSGNKKRKIR